MSLPFNVTVDLEPKIVMTDEQFSQYLDRMAAEYRAWLDERETPSQALTPEQAAEMLACSTQFLLTLERYGLLRPLRWGKNWTRYDARQINHLLRHPEVAAAAYGELVAA